MGEENTTKKIIITTESNGEDCLRRYIKSSLFGEANINNIEEFKERIFDIIEKSETYIYTSYNDNEIPKTSIKRPYKINFNTDNIPYIEDICRENFLMRLIIDESIKEKNVGIIEYIMKFQEMIKDDILKELKKNEIKTEIIDDIWNDLIIVDFDINLDSNEIDNKEILKILFDNCQNFKPKNNELNYLSKQGNNQIRLFRSYNTTENKIMDMAYNGSKYKNNARNININNPCKLYEIVYLDKVEKYPKKIRYFIENDKNNDKNFTITFYEDGKSEFDFENLGDISYEVLKEKIYKILNSFENTEIFDDYLSWMLCGLAKFNLKNKQDYDKILFFHDIGTDNIEEIIRENPDKICILDFSFNPSDLKEDYGDVKDKEFREKYEKTWHNISLIYFDNKILGLNTGFESKKAFKNLKEKLKELNVKDMIQSPRDVDQIGGSCAVASKFLMEVFLSSVEKQSTMDFLVENYEKEDFTKLFIKEDELIKKMENYKNIEEKYKKYSDKVLKIKNLSSNIDFMREFEIFLTTSMKLNDNLAELNPLFFNKSSKFQNRSLKLAYEKMEKMMNESPTENLNPSPI